MAIPRCLAAAAVLALSISGATACDDYADELAMAAAVNAAKLAQEATSQPQAVAGTPSAPDQTSVALVAPNPAQTQTTEVAADALRR